MLTETEPQAAAESLLDAERTRVPVVQLSKTYPQMQIEDAYRVQDLWAEGRIAKGASVVGHKIGLTSRATQMASNMTELDGRILDDALYNDGAQIRADRFIKPRLEVELAFVMGSDLEGAGARVHDVLRATEFVVPALEIIDYRTEVPRAIVDTIADGDVIHADYGPLGAIGVSFLRD
jgi:2-oxo-hept-3-ene-1,7-dioate hydratase